MIYLGTEYYDDENTIISYFYQNNKIIVCNNYEDDKCDIFHINGDFYDNINKKGIIKHEMKIITIINNEDWHTTFIELINNMALNLLKDL